MKKMNFNDCMNKYNEENCQKIDKEGILKQLNLMIEKIEELSNNKEDIEYALRAANKIIKWVKGGKLENMTKTQLKKFIDMFEKFKVKYSRSEKEKSYNHFMGEYCRRLLNNMK